MHFIDRVLLKFYFMRKHFVLDLSEKIELSVYSVFYQAFSNMFEITATLRLAI